MTSIHLPYFVVNSDCQWPLICNQSQERISQFLHLIDFIRRTTNTNMIVSFDQPWERQNSLFSLIGCLAGREDGSPIQELDKSLIGLDNCFKRLDKTPHMEQVLNILVQADSFWPITRGGYILLSVIGQNWDLVEALYCWQEVMQQVLCVLREPVRKLKIKDSDCDWQLFYGWIW